LLIPRKEYGSSKTIEANIAFAIVFLAEEVFVARSLSVPPFSARVIRDVAFKAAA
jgi:hypothetical protein